MDSKIEIAVEIPCQLGESPIWDTRQKTLHFVDILSSCVYSYKPSSCKTQKTMTPSKVGAIVPCEDGNFLAACQDGIYKGPLPSDGHWHFLVDLEKDHMENRLNDGKCDPDGRLWIGSMHLEEKENKGALYVVTRDLQYKKVLDETTISNGMDWDRSASWFYHIDSDDKSVKRYQFDRYGVKIFDPQSIITFEEGEGVPDGMTIDSDGMLWVAHFGGGCVSRRNPDTGEILTKIDLPVKQVTSCVFGGDKMNDLYITTAAKGMSEQDKMEQPEAGFTFVVRNCKAEGMRAFEFGV